MAYHTFLVGTPHHQERVIARSDVVHSNTTLGFVLYWLRDQRPLVAAQTSNIVQHILADITVRSPKLVPHVECLPIGISLPTFWAIIKTSTFLKRDAYHWWRLDECAKHLMASWIISQDHPLILLAHVPILWEVYPTMVVGLKVQARIVQSSSHVYTFDASARFSRSLLCNWKMEVDKGSCTLLVGERQIQVQFSVLDLLDGSLICLEGFTT